MRRKSKQLIAPKQAINHARITIFGLVNLANMRCVLLLFFLFILTHLDAQSGIHHLSDARSQAMAGSTVMNEGIFSLYGNTAGLSQITSLQGIAVMESPFALSELQGAGFGLASPLGSSTLGLKAATFGFDAYRELQFSLAYSRPLNSQLSLGAEMIYWNQNISEYGNKGFLTFALGLQANLSPTLQAGAYLYNPIRARVSEREPTFSSLQIGLVYQASEDLDLVAEVYKDIDFPAQFKAGVDYQIEDTFSLRLGVGTAPTRLSFGLGIKILPDWAIDIAASRHEFLGFSPSFSLRYTGIEKSIK